jgi:hypothetical protein
MSLSLLDPVENEYPDVIEETLDGYCTAWCAHAALAVVRALW